MLSVRSRLALRLSSALIAASLAVTGCAGDSAPVNREAAGLGGGVPKLPSLPSTPLDAIDFTVSVIGLLEGIMSCFEPWGCFGDRTAFEVQQTITRINEQLAEVKAEVAAGIAATRIDIAESSYRQAEQDYNSRFGIRITAAYRALGRMSDESLSAAARQKARRDFEAEAGLLMKSSPEAAIRDFLTTVAGSGESLSQAGLLGASWKLITAQIRQGQGDATGAVPFYLPASSINLMSAMGSQRLIEGAQFVSIIAAYTALLDPDEFATEADQRAFADELNSLWRNGVDGIPGAAAIEASLPRAVPAQSGVFTAVGPDATAGLLVRNFGPVVDTAERTGPIVNADAGYALYPGLDTWLVHTKRRNDPRRELTVSRANADWSYDPATGVLTTTITSTPYPTLKSEVGSLVAVHPNRIAAGEVVPFALAGSVPADRTGWELDRSTSRISVKGRSDLCMAPSRRWSSDGGWTRGYDKIGPDFDTVNVSVENSALPRIVLRDCAPDSLQQWFLNGPVPSDGLPFWSPTSLLSVSPTNGAAVDDDTYPLALWRPLTSGDARSMFRGISGQGMRASLLFEQYGSPNTDAVDRALPSVSHPIAWIFEEREGRSVVVPKTPSSREVLTEHRLYDWSGVVLPVLEGSDRGFFVQPFEKGPIIEGREVLTVDKAPWMSTAAVLAIDVDPCTFAFVPLIGSTFSCEYKRQLMRELQAPAVQLTMDSLVRMDPRDAVDRVPSSPSPTVSPTPSISPTSTVSPTPSISPTSTVSPTPTASESDEPVNPTSEPEESPSGEARVGTATGVTDAS